MRFNQSDFPYSYAVWYLKETSAFWAGQSADEIEKAIDKIPGARIVYRLLADLYIEKHNIEKPDWYRRYDGDKGSEEIQ